MLYVVSKLVRTILSRSAREGTANIAKPLTQKTPSYIVIAGKIIIMIIATKLSLNLLFRVVKFSRFGQNLQK